MSSPTLKPLGRALRLVRLRTVLTLFASLLVLAMAGSWMYSKATGLRSTYGYVLGDVVLVGAPVEGQIATVEVWPGQRVKKGAILARLRDDAIRPDVELARSAAERAELAVTAERAACAIAFRQLASDRAQAAEKLRAAHADKNVARYVAERAEHVAGRFATLAETHLAAVADRDDSRSTALSLKADYARRRAVELETREALAALDVAEAALKARVERIALLEADVASARASLEAAEGRLELTIIRAQDDGEVTRRLRGPGASIRFGDPIVELWITGPPAVEAWIDESSASALSLGTEVRVSFEGLAGSFTGRIDAVAMVSDAEVRSVSVTVPVANRLASSRWLRAHVALDRSDERLVPGLSAEVAIIQGKGVRR
jgi:multidrug resistance efflux pump